MAHKLRVTIEPGVVREVDDAELVDLARQGLVHSYEHTDDAKAVLHGAGVDASLIVNRWKDADKASDVVTAPAAATATKTDTKGA